MRTDYGLRKGYRYISMKENYLTNLLSFRMNDWQGATWPPNLIHKHIWHLVGGYSVEFSPGMYSDPDFSMKLWKSGYSLFQRVVQKAGYTILDQNRWEE